MEEQKYAVIILNKMILVRNKYFYYNKIICYVWKDKVLR